jgi:hypothetical protein
MRVPIRRFSPMWIFTACRSTTCGAQFLAYFAPQDRSRAHRRHLGLALHPSNVRVSYFTMPAISADRDVDFVMADLRRQRKIAVSIESCQLFSHKFRSTSLTIEMVKLEGHRFETTLI